ncbi:RNA-directed DNA polymerase, eukaryota, reverse transcriptase zinc-binding domain protein [Tanacetum coccineum]
MSSRRRTSTSQVKLPAKFGDSICNVNVKVVIFEEDLVKEGCKKWEITVRGYFVGAQMSLAEVKYNVRRMWGRHGLERVFMNGLNFILSNVEVRRKSEPTDLPIWVKLMNILMEAWTQKGISTLASSLDRPIIMDTMTTKICHRGAEKFGFKEFNAIRDCQDSVEIYYFDTNKVNQITKTVHVEYPWKPAPCNHFKGDNEGFVALKPKKKSQIANIGNERVVEMMYRPKNKA